MTEPVVAFQDYLCNVGADMDSDHLRDGIVLPTRLLMDVEASQQIRAQWHERAEGEETHRNGYRERLWETWVVEVPLRIPKLRRGGCFTGLLEARRQAAWALLAVIQTAYVKGVCTRNTQCASLGQPPQTAPRSSVDRETDFWSVGLRSLAGDELPQFQTPCLPLSSESLRSSCRSPRHLLCYCPIQRRRTDCDSEASREHSPKVGSALLAMFLA